MDQPTPQPKPQPQLARFGQYEADLERRILTKAGLRIRLQDQPFQVLASLLRNPGQVVTREEIRISLWPAETFVEFDDGLNTAIKKLRAALGDSADNPRFIETIPRRGYRFVAPVSFPKPLPEAAAPVTVTEEPALPGPSPVDIQLPDQEPTRSHPWVLVVILFVGAILGVYLYFAAQKPARQNFVAQAKMRPSVAVLGFRNSSGNADSAWLSTAFSEMLNTELAADEKLRTIPGESVSRVKADYALRDGDGLAPDTLDHVHQGLNADFVVVGSYFDMGKKSDGAVRMDLRVQDARTGETIASLTETGSEIGLPDLAARTGADLRRSLGASTLSPEQAASTTLAIPANAESSRLYSEGLERLRGFDALSARTLLEQAIGKEPNFALAHAALADALSPLGYDLEARAEAKKAFELSGGLSREQRLWIEGHYRTLNSDWTAATDAYGKLLTLFPDNLEYGLKLASAQSNGGHNPEALATLERLRKLPEPASGDPRIDLVEVAAQARLGNFQQEASAAIRTAENAQALGARLLVAEARHRQCWAQHRLGKEPEARSACEAAKQLFTQAGDRVSVASLLVTMGAVLEEQGELAGARSNYEEAIPIYRAVGAQGGLAAALNNLAIVLRNQGDYAGAGRSYEKSIAIARSIGDRDGLVLALGNLATLFVHEGDLRRAAQTFRDLLSICREIGSKPRIALQLDNYAQTIYLLGDLTGAQQALEEARALDTESGEKRQLGYHLAALGDLFQAQGKLQEARQMREGALKIRTELGDEGDAADARVSLAQSSIEEGNPHDALAPLRQAVQELGKLKIVDDQVTAYSVLAQALLQTGDASAAVGAIDQATSIESKSHDVGVHFAFAIADARVRGASGKSAEARDILRTALKEIEKDGFVGLAFDARFAMSEIEVKAGSTGASGRLKALELDARRRGYLLIADKAAALVRPSLQ